jgi:hypothetical protein
MLSATEIDNITRQSQHETAEERLHWRDIKHVLVVTEVHGKKKSKKTSGPDLDYSLKPDLCLRVNYDRYNVHIRDEAIVHATEERWNKGAAAIMKAILAAALKDESTMTDDRTHNSVNINEIIDKIPKEAIGKIVDGMEGATQKRYSDAVKQFLRLMAEEDAVMGSGNPFLSYEPGSAAYKVEFERIAVKLRENLMAKLVRERLGEPAARVLAVVARAGKVSETTVSRHPRPGLTRLTVRFEITQWCNSKTPVTTSPNYKNYRWSRLRKSQKQPSNRVWVYHPHQNGIYGKLISHESTTLYYNQSTKRWAISYNVVKRNWRVNRLS